MLLSMNSLQCRIATMIVYAPLVMLRHPCYQTKVKQVLPQNSFSRPMGLHIANLNILNKKS